MSRFQPNEDDLRSLQGKVIVLTGGSNGIGASLVRQLHTLGAHVIFGDVDARRARRLIASLRSSTPFTTIPSTSSTTSNSLPSSTTSVPNTLSSSSSSSPPSPPPANTPSPSRPRILFQKTDVRQHQDIHSLFSLALSEFGHVDHAIYCAGSNQDGRWFDPSLTLADMAEEPTEQDRLALDVNLYGALLFARVACVCLRQQQGGDEGRGGKEGTGSGRSDIDIDGDSADADGNDTGSFAEKSITLLSSIAGLTPAPGLFTYAASKHGVVGLMRSLAPYARLRLGGIRVNAVAPWMTRTGMTVGIEEGWVREGLPVNEAEDVAGVVLGLVRGMKEVTGKCVYVEGGRGWEVEGVLGEDGVESWMGVEGGREWKRGQGVLGMGDDWSKKAGNIKTGDGNSKL